METIPVTINVSVTVNVPAGEGGAPAVMPQVTVQPEGGAPVTAAAPVGAEPAIPVGEDRMERTMGAAAPARDVAPEKLNIKSDAEVRGEAPDPKEVMANLEAFDPEAQRKKEAQEAAAQAAKEDEDDDK